MTGSSFLESGGFPVAIVNIASAKEKGPGRPPFWEMVFWWTRKPLASARATILAAMLSKDFDPGKFIRVVYPSYKSRGEFKKTPHYLNPETRLLDAETYRRPQLACLTSHLTQNGDVMFRSRSKIYYEIRCASERYSSLVLSYGVCPQSEQEGFYGFWPEKSLEMRS